MTYYKTTDNKIFLNLTMCQVYCFNNRVDLNSMETKNPFKIIWLLITCT